MRLVGAFMILNA